MLNDYQNQQLDALLNCDIPVEEALNILVKDNVITYDQANEVYGELCDQRSSRFFAQLNQPLQIGLNTYNHD